MKLECFLIYLVFGSLFSGCASIPSSTDKIRQPYTESYPIEILTQGSCLDEEGESLSLEGMRELGADRVVLKSAGPYTHAEISRGTLRLLISRDAENGETSSGFIDIRLMLKERYRYPEPFDLQLKFVSLGGDSVIYWKEPYENIPFRQGILRYHPGDLDSLCVGRGGSYSSH